MNALAISLMAISVNAYCQLNNRGVQAEDIPDSTGDTVPMFRNPVLPGSYPDPSICRVGDDFYLANSSFEYFPGLPIHHSRDLVNWRLIGYGLHREEQVTGAVNLVDVQSDGGIHAPSLRCVDGRFYLITTNVYLPAAEKASAEMVNFIITAENPAGPWSMPVVIEGAPGIDPDLFFDDDGRVWYVGTRVPEDPNHPGEGEIWLQELDPLSWQLTGSRHSLWRGALKGAIWAEGPHIYKHSGRYYLMIAEGGTSFDHAVTIASSAHITGPYQGNHRNPILTSRHLSYDHWVNSTGHGDLIQLPDERWYMVLLGIRGDVARRSNMGRETFLAPVVWEQEPWDWKAERLLWPVVAAGTGRVERFNPYPLAFAGSRHDMHQFFDDFDVSALNLHWNFRRFPGAGRYSLDERPGYLRLNATPREPQDRGRAALMGFRQTESDFVYEASFEFETSVENAEAGVSIFQKDDNYLIFALRREGSGYVLGATLALPGKSPQRLPMTVVLSAPQTIRLQLSSQQDKYTLSYSTDGGDHWLSLLTTPASTLLSSGYTGAYLGLYARTNETDAATFMDVDWVRYRGYPR